MKTNTGRPRWLSGALLLFGLATLLLAPSAGADTLTYYLSTLSSEPSTNPASDLDATIQFDVTGSSLTITLSNTGTLYDIDEIYFNAKSNVTSLTYNSATHSVEGDVQAIWEFSTSTGQGGPTHGDGFGIHDFSLRDLGESMMEGWAEPGESVVFQFTINGTGPFSAQDFAELSLNTGTGDNIPTYVVAKFVSGPDGCPPDGCDSAYGAIPEPATGALLALGLLGLAVGGRRRGG